MSRLNGTHRHTHTLTLSCWLRNVHYWVLAWSNFFLVECNVCCYWWTCIYNEIKHKGYRSSGTFGNVDCTMMYVCYIHDAISDGIDASTSTSTSRCCCCGLSDVSTTTKKGLFLIDQLKRKDKFFLFFSYNFFIYSSLHLISHHNHHRLYILTGNIRCGSSGILPLANKQYIWLH